MSRELILIPKRRYEQMVNSIKSSEQDIGKKDDRTDETIEETKATHPVLDGFREVENKERRVGKMDTEKKVPIQRERKVKKSVKRKSNTNMVGGSMMKVKMTPNQFSSLPRNDRSRKWLSFTL